MGHSRACQCPSIPATSRAGRRRHLAQVCHSSWHAPARCFLLNQLLSAHLRRNGLHFQFDLHRHYFPRLDEASEEFKRFGSLLCLQILPKYFYTTDGETPYDTAKVGAATTRIKAVEHNINVLNQVLFWADFLSERSPGIELRLDGRPLVVIEKESLSGIAAFA